MPMDYQSRHVSEKVVKIILSYTDYVQERLWRTAGMKHIVLTRFSLFHGVKWPDNSPMWSAMDIRAEDLKDTDKKMAAYLKYLYSEERLA